MSGLKKYNQEIHDYISYFNFLFLKCRYLIFINVRIIIEKVNIIIMTINIIIIIIIEQVNTAAQLCSKSLQTTETRPDQDKINNIDKYNYYNMVTNVL